MILFISEQFTVTFEDSIAQDVSNTVLFQCQSEEYILNVFKCDGRPDCFDESDERDASCNATHNLQGNTLI